MSGLSKDLPIDGFSQFEAVVPLSELLASTSKALAEFSMEFAGYEAMRDRGSSSDYGAGVAANKPNFSRPWTGFGATRPEPEDE
jgi:hypothetical protein